MRIVILIVAASWLPACGVKGGAVSAPPPADDDGGTSDGAASADLGGGDVPGAGSGADYYVAASGDDHDSGTSPDHPWATIAKIDGMTLKPGDTVHLSGKLTDHEITDQEGSASAYIRFVGDGTAVIKGIRLQKSQYLAFSALEAAGATGTQCGSLVTISGSGPVQHIRFAGLHLHDSDRGITVGNHAAGVVGNDLVFADTTIANMQCEGVVFDDYAGDRITVEGGAISNTGIHCPWHADGSGCHGIYASGGHHHVIDGVTFSVPNRSWDVSLRRANTIVSHCRFSGNLMLENVNEDEVVYRGYYYVFANTFTGPGTAIYQGGDNDQGIPDPGNTWSIYDNTFASGEVINFADDGAGYYAYDYDVYMCHNTLDGAVVEMGTTASGVTHDANASQCPHP